MSFEKEEIKYTLYSELVQNIINYLKDNGVHLGQQYVFDDLKDSNGKPINSKFFTNGVSPLVHQKSFYILKRDQGKFNFEEEKVDLIYHEILYRFRKGIRIFDSEFSFTPLSNIVIEHEDYKIIDDSIILVVRELKKCYKEVIKNNEYDIFKFDIKRITEEGPHSQKQQHAKDIYTICSEYNLGKHALDKLQRKEKELGRFPIFLAIHEILKHSPEDIHEFMLKYPCIYKSSRELPAKIYLNTIIKDQSIPFIKYCEKVCNQLSKAVDFNNDYKTIDYEEINRQESTRFSYSFYTFVISRCHIGYEILPKYEEVRPLFMTTKKAYPICYKKYAREIMETFYTYKYKGKIDIIIDLNDPEEDLIEIIYLDCFNKPLTYDDIIGDTIIPKKEGIPEDTIEECKNLALKLGYDFTVEGNTCRDIKFCFKALKG